MARVSPTKTTGGGGFDFEDYVAAYFLACMLRNKHALGSEHGPIIRLDWQTESKGWVLDDLLVTTSANGVEHHVPMSIKSYSQLGTKKGIDEDFTERAWKLYLGVGGRVFDPDRDYLGIINAPNPNGGLDREFDKLLRRAREKDPATLGAELDIIRNATGPQRTIFKSFEGPAGMASARATSAEDTAKLLSRVVSLRFDFESPNSEDKEKTIELCREALRSNSRQEAETLREALLGICKDYRSYGGYVDIPTLVGRLVPRFMLYDYADFSRDWGILTYQSKSELQKYQTTIGGKVELERVDATSQLESALSSDSQPIVALIGPSGCGKTILAVRYARRKMLNSKVIWKDAEALTVPDYGGFETSLHTDYTLDELLDSIVDPMGYVIVDGLDRLYEDAPYKVLSALAQKLKDSKAASRWRLLLTCQEEEWARVSSQLTSLRMVVKAVRIAEPSDKELQPVWDEFPELAPLRFQQDLHSLLYKPKVLHRLAVNVNQGSLKGMRKFVGQSDFINWVWDMDIGDKKHGLMMEELAIWLADRQATDLGRSTLRNKIPPHLLLALQYLVANHICLDHDGLVSFEHDLYGDWARQRALIRFASQPGFWLSLKEKARSPLWHRAIRLYGIHLLETDPTLGAWRSAVASLSASDGGTALAQDLVLEAAIFATQPRILLESTWPVLAENDGVLLQRLLTRFLYVATSEDAAFTELLRRDSPERDVFLAATFRNPEPWYFIPVLTFLHAHATQACDLAPQQVARVAQTWLVRADVGWPLRREAAELALTNAERLLIKRITQGKLASDPKEARTAYTAALVATRELPERASEFVLRAVARRDRQSRATEEDDERQVVPSYTYFRTEPWPDGPRSEVDSAFRIVCLEGEGYGMYWLITQIPEVAREALLAMLIKEPREAEDYDLMPPPALPAYIPHDYELEDNYIWDVPKYDSGPFLLFLTHAPEQGLDAIIRLVNFATERWGEPKLAPNRGYSFAVELEGQTSKWLGDNDVYYWYRGGANTPDAVGSALMALEKWLYDLRDANNPLARWIATILQGSRSAAFGGVLSALGCKDPTLYREPLRHLLAIPEFHFWERATLGDSSMDSHHRGWWQMALSNEEAFNRARDWLTLPHRECRLQVLAHELFRSDPTVRSHIERFRVRWIERRDALEPELELHYALNILINWYDPANFVVPDKPDDPWQLKPQPTPQIEPAARRELEELNERARLGNFVFDCTHILRGEKPPPTQAELEELWSKLQKLSANPTLDASADIFNAKDALAAGLAVILCYGTGWLKEDPNRWAWCKGTVLSLLRQWDVRRAWHGSGNRFNSASKSRPISRLRRLRMAFIAGVRAGVRELIHPSPQNSSNLHDLLPDPEAAKVDTDREGFLAWALPMLWVEEPQNREIRKYVGVFAFSHHYHAVELLFRSAASVRARLGEAFGQIQHLLVLCAVLRWRLKRAENMDDNGRSLTAHHFDKEARKEIDRFASGKLATQPPRWDEVVEFEAPFKEKKRGRIIHRYKRWPRMDLYRVKAGYSWLPPLSEARDANERGEWLHFWREALRWTMSRLGEYEEDVEVDGRPDEWDLWVFSRLPAVILNMSADEQPSTLWEPLLNKGVTAHQWVESFLGYWISAGFSENPMQPAFLHEWRAMTAFACDSPAWSFDTGHHRSSHLGSMWVHLVGLDNANKYRWSAEHRPVVQVAEDVYERWAEKCVASNTACLEALVWFLRHPAGNPLLLEGMQWIARATQSPRTQYFWTAQDNLDRVATLLEMYWNEVYSRLGEYPAARQAFMSLLEKMAGDHQHTTAFEILHRINAGTLHVGRSGGSFITEE